MPAYQLPVAVARPGHLSVPRNRLLCELARLEREPDCFVKLAYERIVRQVLLQFKYVSVSR